MTKECHRCSYSEYAELSAFCEYCGETLCEECFGEGDFLKRHCEKCLEDQEEDDE